MEIPLEISNTSTPQLVSLLTDYGNKDYYVARLKAKLLNTSQTLEIIDVSHEIETHDIVKASFFLHNYFRDFPVNTIHIVAVNNAYNSTPQLICFEYEGHYFMGPNNGIFSLEFQDIEVGAFRLINDSSDPLLSLNDKISNTVHHIIKHGHINNLGESLPNFEQKLSIKAVINKNEIRASVIHVDNYKNVIVNLKKEDFEKHQLGRRFSIYIKPTDPIEKISNSFADVLVGDVLCLFNDSDYLTIAINNGKASSMYSLERNDTIQILFY